ncbi:MAG: HAMP domain-containing protein, partial [Melioribacteraceae bacterium]
QLLLGSYILRLGLRSITISLAAALVLSFIIVGFTTRNFRKITSVIRNFKNGDLTTRVNIKSKSELGEFAESFNEMADTIVHNIDEIKKMDLLRRELIANVSHDLRTPISIIQGYLETVLIKSDTLSNEEKIKYLETTLDNTKRLQVLVEELFELSKLESKQITPNFEMFSLAELLQDIQQKNSLVIKSKEIDFKIDAPQNLPMINADIAMMEKVFQNLLDNSLKFTSAGGEINIKLINNINSILIKFSDTGCGIEKEELPHIFERYHKSKRVVSNQKGTGLGLAIVKKILELHEINISVESEKDKGTTFYFEIRKV